jgi:hypothetical protein
MQNGSCVGCSVQNEWREVIMTLQTSGRLFLTASLGLSPFILYFFFPSNTIFRNCRPVQPGFVILHILLLSIKKSTCNPQLYHKYCPHVLCTCSEIFWADIHSMHKTLSAYFINEIVIYPLYSKDVYLSKDLVMKWLYALLRKLTHIRVKFNSS